MKILQIPSWYLPEGGHFCLNQSMALQEAGIDVHILANVVLPWRKYKLSIFNYPIKAFFSIENNIPIYRYYSWKYPFVDIPNIRKWVAQTVKMFDRYNEEHGSPDIIHVHSSMWGGYAAALIKEKYGIPYVITEHRGIFGSKSSFAKALLKNEYKLYLEKAFSQADYIIPVSDQLTEKISEYLTNPVPIKSISNILDTEYFSPIQRKHKGNTPFTFISVNGYYIEKGYDILLPAFDKLCKLNPNVNLRLIGENFDYADFQKILEKVKHKEKISFTGEIPREGVRKELWEADAFVIASRIESQSVATLEAMSTGLPIVATSVIPNTMITNTVGYRVEIEDVNALSEAMLQMIQNKDSFDSTEISNHVKEIAGKEAVVSQLIEVYKEVLSK